jgi:hypothetical protein
MYWLASSVLSLQVPTASARSTLSNVELSEAQTAIVRGTLWATSALPLQFKV